MHIFLVHAVPAVPRCNEPRLGYPILAFVARGPEEAAQGLMLGELNRAGWKVLEVVDHSVVRDQFPGLKRRQDVAQVMEAAMVRGVGFFVLPKGSE